MDTTRTGEATAERADPATDLETYRQLLRIRSFEEAAYRAYENGLVAGTIHASIGQEAVAVGVIGALRPDDKVFSHHRGHGHALAKGMDPGRLMAELFGRRDGVCGGRGGSMHITDVSHGFLGSLAIVGSAVPVAVGVALSQKMGGSDAVCVSFFGDGAVNQGVVYESFNLAAMWGAPVLFVCENNAYAISMPAAKGIAGPGLVDRARAFGMAARSIDGQDVRVVRSAVGELLRDVRRGVPTVLECRTYRFMGHSRGDPPHGLYRSSDEVAEWRTRDPIAILERSLAASEEERTAIRAAVRDEMDRAVAFAKASPPADPATLLADVWGDADGR